VTRSETAERHCFPVWRQGDQRPLHLPPCQRRRGLHPRGEPVASRDTRHPSSSSGQSVSPRHEVRALIPSQAAAAWKIPDSPATFIVDARSSQCTPSIRAAQDLAIGRLHGERRKWSHNIPPLAPADRAVVRSCRSPPALHEPRSTEMYVRTSGPRAIQDPQHVLRLCVPRQCLPITSTA